MIEIGNRKERGKKRLAYKWKSTVKVKVPLLSTEGQYVVQPVGKKLIHKKTCIHI